MRVGWNKIFLESLPTTLNFKLPCIDCFQHWSFYSADFVRCVCTKPRR